MPSIELLAEVQALKEQVEGYKTCVKYMDEKDKELCQLWSGIAREKLRADRSEHMAALWKRCAKKYHEQIMDDDMAMDAAYWEIDAGLQAKHELAALKKDARSCCVCRVFRQQRNQRSLPSHHRSDEGD